MAINERPLRLAGALALLMAVVGLASGCNGDDIQSLPEANGASVSVFGNPLQFPNSQNWSPDYLAGEAFPVSRAGGIAAIGMWTPQAGCSAELAVYSDAGGLPGALEASTGPFTTAVGANVYPPVGPASISAGTHWILFHFGGAGCEISSDDAQAVNAQYLFLPFGSPLPEPMPATTSYAHVALNLFVVMP